MMTQFGTSAASAFGHAAVRRSTANLPWCSRSPPPSSPPAMVTLTKKPAARCWSLSSSLRDDNASSGAGAGTGSEVVEEGMHVLRRRILEMKMAEELEEEYSILEEEETPEKWRRGGRQHIGGSDGQLLHVLGEFLMGSRPGVAVGIAVFLMVSLPTSVFFAVCSRSIVEWQRLVFNLTNKW